MSRWTKVALTVTCVSAAVLLLTGNVTQALVANRTGQYCIVTWRIPFYRSIRVSESAWWIFTRIWLVSLLAPPLAWLLVATAALARKIRFSN